MYVIPKCKCHDSFYFFSISDLSINIIVKECRLKYYVFFSIMCCIFMYHFTHRLNLCECVSLGLLARLATPCCTWLGLEWCLEMTPQLFFTCWTSLQWWASWMECVWKSVTVHYLMWEVLYDVQICSFCIRVVFFFFFFFFFSRVIVRQRNFQVYGRVILFLEITTNEFQKLYSKFNTYAILKLHLHVRCTNNLSWRWLGN